MILPISALAANIVASASAAVAKSAIRFEELGLSPNIVFSSPSIEMVRGMVGQGFGFSLLVTRPHSECTYDGKKVVAVDIAEDVTGSGLAAAWLKRAQLTKPAQLFVEFCKEQLGTGGGGQVDTTTAR